MTLELLPGNFINLSSSVYGLCLNNLSKLFILIGFLSRCLTIYILTTQKQHLKKIHEFRQRNCLQYRKILPVETYTLSNHADTANFALLWKQS